MRVVHVVTVCAALISTFRRAETVHSERRPQSKDRSLQPTTDDLPVSEITFTTIRPELSSFSQNSMHTHVRQEPKKRPSKVRPSRSMSRPQNPNRSKANRRRRQLQRYGGKTAHVGRSYDIIDNHVDQHIETIQGPLEAFNEGAIHIEPIYRVAKNKGFVDSLIGILRQLVDPPKSLGPLVGPFHFPGLGDKVYIRLLESVEPDNLVIKLISHSPVVDVESFEKNLHSEVPIVNHDVKIHSKIPHVNHHFIPHEISSASHDLLTHSGAHSVGHDLYSHSKYSSIDALGSSFSQHSNSPPSSDSSSSTKDVIRVSKSPKLTGPANRPNQLFVSGTYSVNLKNGEPVTIKRVVRHRSRSQHPPPATKDSHVDFNLRPEPAKQNFFEAPYQFQFKSNESVHRSPSSSFDSQSSNTNDHSQFLPTRSPTSSMYQAVNRSSEPAPRYSLDFTSKKMSYLNMDGTVDTPDDTNDDKGFKPMVLNPAAPKLTRSVGGRQETFKTANSRVQESSISTMRDQKNPRERDDVVWEARKTFASKESNYSRSSDKKSDEQHESSINNSTQATVKPVSGAASVNSKQLSSQKQLESKRNSDKPRNV